MSKVELAQWVLIGFLALRSVVQHVYIGRLKGALLNVVEALAREPSLKINDVLRGGLRVGKKDLKLCNSNPSSPGRTTGPSGRNTWRSTARASGNPVAGCTRAYPVGLRCGLPRVSQATL